MGWPKANGLALNDLSTVMLGYDGQRYPGINLNIEESNLFGKTSKLLDLVEQGYPNLHVDCLVGTVLPYLFQHAFLFWGYTTCKNLETIFQLQNRALRDTAGVSLNFHLLVSV